MNTITSSEKLLVSVGASSLDSRGWAAVVAESYRKAGQLQLIGVVTSGEVTVRHFLQGGRLALAAILRVFAARMEIAAAGRVGGIGDLATEDNLIFFEAGIGLGHSRQERLGIRMLGVKIERFGIGEFNDFADIHDGDAVGDVLNDAEVVRDEEISQFQLFLQVLQQVENLRLDRDIKGGDRLIGDDQARVRRQGAGNADALALTAGRRRWDSD